MLIKRMSMAGSLSPFHSGELPAAVGANMNAGAQALRFGGMAQFDCIGRVAGIADAQGRIGAAGVRDRAPGQRYPGFVGAS
jgi:hypothetical protein